MFRRDRLMIALACAMSASGTMAATPATAPTSGGAAPSINLTTGMAGEPAAGRGQVTAAAPAPARLSLKEAEQQALQNHPRVRAGQFAAQAAGEMTREARASYFPAVFGAVTGAEAHENSRITAGGLNNPTILDRLAVGFSVSQLVTDFGRTPALVASSSLRARAYDENVANDTANVLLQVDRAYFDALRAQAVRRVAEETVAARQLVVDQVTALAQSNLKSSLDVSFSRVNLGEAQLLLVQAQNDVQAAYARLTAALGAQQPGAFALVDEPLPDPPPPDPDPLVREALRSRPDLASERLFQQSEEKFAAAERALRLPTVAVAGAFGATPYRQAGLASDYAAVGINVSVPLTNGNLFAARATEAALRARGEAEQVLDLETRVARDVRVAWLDARTAFQRVDLTNQLLAQAADALELAQARYNLGLSSIVELTQAQLNKTRAEIEQASARYDYQARVAGLKYQTGTLQ